MAIEVFELRGGEEARRAEKIAAQREWLREEANKQAVLKKLRTPWNYTNRKIGYMLAACGVRYSQVELPMAHVAYMAQKAVDQRAHVLTAAYILYNDLCGGRPHLNRMWRRCVGFDFNHSQHIYSQKGPHEFYDKWIQALRNGEYGDGLFVE